MNEVLATHENIENNEALSSDELRALQAINNFFDKNIDTDHILKEDLEQENSDISSDVLDAYNTLKDDIMFLDAYATQEYQLHRSSVIDYLTNNF